MDCVPDRVATPECQSSPNLGPQRSHPTPASAGPIRHTTSSRSLGRSDPDCSKTAFRLDRKLTRKRGSRSFRSFRTSPSSCTVNRDYGSEQVREHTAMSLVGTSHLGSKGYDSPDAKDVQAPVNESTETTETNQASWTQTTSIGITAEHRFPSASSEVTPYFPIRRPAEIPSAIATDIHTEQSEQQTLTPTPLVAPFTQDGHLYHRCLPLGHTYQSGKQFHHNERRGSGIEDNWVSEPQSALEWKVPRGISGIVEPHDPVPEALVSEFDLTHIICPFKPISGKKNRNWFYKKFERLFRTSGVLQSMRVLGFQSAAPPTKSQDACEPNLFASGPDVSLVGNWAVLQGITKGMSSTRIHLAFERRCGKVHIIKSTKAIVNLPRKQATYLLNEWKVLEILQGLAETKKRFLLGPSRDVGLWAWRDQHALYTVTDICLGGDLLPFVGLLEGDRLKIIVAEIALGLEALHTLNIVHHDMKPSNVFIHQDGHIRLSDFGGSQFIAPGQKLLRKESELQLIADSDYWAPELFVYDARNTAYYDEGADYYSFGATLFHLISGEVLFPGPHLSFGDKVKLARRGPVDAWYRLQASNDLRDFVTQLLVVDPCHRLRGKHVRKHPYLSAFKGKWKSMKEMKCAGPFSDHDFSEDLRKFCKPASEDGSNAVRTSTTHATPDTWSSHTPDGEHRWPSLQSSSTDSSLYSAKNLSQPRLSGCAMIPEHQGHELQLQQTPILPLTHNIPQALVDGSCHPFFFPPQLELVQPVGQHSPPRHWHHKYSHRDNRVMYPRFDAPVIPPESMRRFVQANRMSNNLMEPRSFPTPATQRETQRYDHLKSHPTRPQTDLRKLLVEQGLDLLYSSLFEEVYARFHLCSGDDLTNPP